MAAPPEATVQNMNGTWVMDKKLSDDPDPALKLQGIGWLTRKAIGVTTINIEFIQTTKTDPETSNPVIQIIANQSAIGGAGGTTETRIMDWREREHSDMIFGNVIARSRFIGGIRDVAGNIRPNLDLQTPGGQDDGKFLTEVVLARGDNSVGEQSSGLFIHDYIVSSSGGWTAEQVWAFEIIDGERFLTRRALVAKGSSYITTRVVYKFVK